MKKLLLTSLLCFCVSAYAVNWKKVTEGFNHGHSYYVDIDNIKKHNGLVYYWELVDYLEPIGNVNSTIYKWKVDCGEEKLTWLSETTYSQSMGKGRIVGDVSGEIKFKKIHYPKPESVGYEVMKFACDNAK